MRWMFSGSPSSQDAKPGEAMRLFSFIASAVRFASGMKLSISTTPTLRIGGCWMCRTRFSRVTFWPFFQQWATMLLIRICSGDCTGSASISMSPSMEETVLSMRSASVSASSMTSTGGQSSELRMDTGRPALLPGV